MDLKKEISELYKKAATEMPEDIVKALEQAKEAEEKEASKEILSKILENINKARSDQVPICQDTGIPIFYIKYPKEYSQEELTNTINEATDIATEEIPLRPNAVDSLTDKSLGNKAIIHFEESASLIIQLMLKGGGSENVSTIYRLPNKNIEAFRNLDGVRKCVLDSIVNAQGKGCPPYIIGVAIGGSIEEVASLAKKQLLRKIDDKNENNELENFEKTVLEEVNQLGIGPLGLGGKTTALAVKAASSPRHPATFFVGISIGCWALRRNSYEKTSDSN